MDDSELQRRVHEHRLFFDKLVELVPAKIYISKEDDENKWHYGMSKAQRAAAKQATKENLKKAKRDRLDPDKFTSTADLLQQRLETSNKPENDEAETGTNGKTQGGKESRAATYEALRERLHKRMELLRAKRNSDAAVTTARKARSWKNEKKQNSVKRKRNDSFAGLDTSANVATIMSKRPKQAPIGIESGDMQKKTGVEGADTFEFGRVKMGLQSDVNRRSKKRRKESKEQLLAKATKLQSDMQDPKIGQDVSMKHSWNAALSRSSGEKIFDDPGRLKQSLKREKHQRQKSSKKWEERKETVKQSVDAKQRTRHEHIKERKQQKIEKKISKREKKLSRPGFEGRREKFINE